MPAQDEIDNNEIFEIMDRWDGTDEQLNEDDIERLAQILAEESNLDADGELIDEDLIDHDGEGIVRRAFGALAHHAQVGGAAAKEQSIAALHKMFGLLSAAGRGAGKVGRLVGDVFEHLARLVQRYRRPMSRLASAVGADSFSVGVAIPLGATVALSFPIEP